MPRSMAHRLACLPRRWPNPAIAERAKAAELGQWLSWAWSIPLDHDPLAHALAAWRNLVDHAGLPPAGVAEAVRLALRRFGVAADVARQLVTEPTDVDRVFWALAQPDQPEEWGRTG